MFNQTPGLLKAPLWTQNGSNGLNSSAASLPSTPVGQKTVDPNTKVVKPPNTTPQPAPAPAPAPSGQIGTPSTINPYIQPLGNFNPNTDPGVSRALGNQLNFENQYVQGQQARSTLPNAFGYQTNLMDINAAGHAALSPVYQSQVSQAYTGAGQHQAGLSAAAGLSAPQQVSPGNFYVSPLTGQDVTGGQISPFTGGQRLAQVTQGQNFQQGQGTIAGARNVVNQFNQALAQHPEFQSNPLNLQNLVNNALQNNYSNPDFPQIQSAFNSAVNQYRVILGDTIVNNLLSTSKNTTLSQILSSLDSQAQGVNQGNLQAGMGQGAGQAPQPYTAPQPQASGSVYNGITLPH